MVNNKQNNSDKTTNQHVDYRDYTPGLIDDLNTIVHNEQLKDHEAKQLLYDLIGEEMFEGYPEPLENTTVDNGQKTDQDNAINEIREKTTDIHNALFNTKESEKIDIQKHHEANILLKGKIKGK